MKDSGASQHYCPSFPGNQEPDNHACTGTMGTFHPSAGVQMTCRCFLLPHLIWQLPVPPWPRPIIASYPLNEPIPIADNLWTFPSAFAVFGFKDSL
ncbi:hypothetical protein LEMLEM_LOCUS20531 [Lemmus lemmus]